MAKNSQSTLKPTERDNKLQKAAHFLAHPSEIRRDGQGYGTHRADKE
jgi:hypothetical protein